MYKTTTLEAELDKVASRVTLSADEKNYVVTGDPRVGNGASVAFDRVSTTTAILDKYALRNWMVNTSLGYIQDNWKTFSKEVEKHVDPSGKVKEDKKSQEKYGEIFDKARGAPNEKRDTAGNYGTRAHSIVQELADGTREDAIPPDLRRVASAWKDWIESSELEIIKTEQPFYWQENGLTFAGTADLIARRDSKIYIVDYKTGGSDTRWRPYPEMALQLGAYSLCLEYCTGIPVEDMGAIVVKLPKDAPSSDTNYTVKFKEVEDLSYAREAFLSACFLKSWQSLKSKLWKK